jgi:hypothetical protein
MLLVDDDSFSDKELVIDKNKREKTKEKLLSEIAEEDDISCISEKPKMGKRDSGAVS